VKKVLLALALLAPAATSAKIMVNGIVKLGDAQASRSIVLQDDQTRFHYWMANGLMLIGHVQKITANGAELLLAFGKKASDSNPEDPAVRFERMLAKTISTTKWGEAAELKAHIDEANMDLTISITLSPVD